MASGGWIRRTKSDKQPGLDRGRQRRVGCALDSNTQGHGQGSEANMPASLQNQGHVLLEVGFLSAAAAAAAVAVAAAAAAAVAAAAASVVAVAVAIDVDVHCC
jgi:hypothetical protein